MSHQLVLINKEFMAQPSDTTRADKRRDDRKSSPQYKTIITTALITAVITGTITWFLPYLIGLFRGDLKSQIVNEINQSISPISKDILEIKTKVAVLDNKIENIDRYVFKELKSRAAAVLKTDNPSISYVKLAKNFTFSENFRFAIFPNEISVTVTVLGIRDDNLILRPEAKFAGSNQTLTFSPKEISIPLEPGVLAIGHLYLHINNQRLPPVHIAVLQRPSPDTAILAMGIGIEPEKRS